MGLRYIRCKTTPKRKSKRKRWDIKVVKKRGRSFTIQHQAGICSCYCFCLKEAKHWKKYHEPLIPFSQARKRTAALMNCCLGSVTKYVNRGFSGEPFGTPGKDRKREALKRNVSNNVKEQIRQLIYDACDQRRHITCAQLLNEIRANGVPFYGKAETLRKVLHDMGFEHKQRNNNRYLTEQPYVIAARIAFLAQYKANMDALAVQQKKVYSKSSVAAAATKGKPFIFQDETWVFRHGTGKTREWQDTSIRSVSVKKASSGPRYIVCHAGGRKGFVEGASMFVNSSKKVNPLDDYHAQMNKKVFLEWFESRLLNNLKEPSIIVLDNASYHSSQEEEKPTSSWTVAKLKDWLTNEGIPYNSTDRKKTLYQLCIDHKKPAEYDLETLCAKTHHTILRTPPYCFFYNPIENIWGLCKRYYDAHLALGGDYTEKKAIETWNDALTKITPEVWNKCVNHTEKRVLSDYERFCVNKEIIEILDNGGPDENDYACSENPSEMITVTDYNDDDTEEMISFDYKSPPRRRLFEEYNQASLNSDRMSIESDSLTREMSIDKSNEPNLYYDDMMSFGYKSPPRRRLFEEYNQASLNSDGMSIESDSLTREMSIDKSNEPNLYYDDMMSFGYKSPPRRRLFDECNETSFNNDEMSIESNSRTGIMLTDESNEVNLYDDEIIAFGYDCLSRKKLFDESTEVKLGYNDKTEAINYLDKNNRQNLETSHEEIQLETAGKNNFFGYSNLVEERFTDDTDKDSNTTIYYNNDILVPEVIINYSEKDNSYSMEDELTVAVKSIETFTEPSCRVNTILSEEYELIHKILEAKEQKKKKSKVNN